MKYTVAVPIVGYSCVNVKAESEEEAIEKAIDLACEFENENVELEELYGENIVVEGNICHHPYCEAEVVCEEEE